MPKNDNNFSFCKELKKSSHLGGEVKFRTATNVATSLPFISNQKYQYNFNTRFEFGEIAYAIVNNNFIEQIIINEIGFFVTSENRCAITYNGFHSNLVFSLYEEAKNAMEATFCFKGEFC